LSDANTVILSDSSSWKYGLNSYFDKYGRASSRHMRKTAGLESFYRYFILE